MKKQKIADRFCGLMFIDISFVESGNPADDIVEFYITETNLE